MLAQVYNRMNTRAGLKDHSAVLNLMIAKIANNRKVYSECEDIIQATLGLFQACPQPDPATPDVRGLSCAMQHRHQCLLYTHSDRRWHRSFSIA